MLYDPKDPFSLLNPYSAPNTYSKGQKELGELNERIVSESAKYLGHTQRSDVYPSYSGYDQPLGTASTVSSSTKVGHDVNEIVAFLLAVGIFAGAAAILMM